MIVSVPLTQYVAPDGAPRPGTVDLDLPDEIIREIPRMQLSCEVLRGTGEVAIYGRWDDEDDESEIVKIARNDDVDPDRSPPAVVRNVIDRLMKRREGQS